VADTHRGMVGGSALRDQYRLKLSYPSFLPIHPSFPFLQDPKIRTNHSFIIKLAEGFLLHSTSYTFIFIPILYVLPTLPIWAKFVSKAHRFRLAGFRF